MFGRDQYRHYLRVALFSAAFALSVCFAQQQEIQDELRDKHVTSPLIEGRMSLADFNICVRA